jgi:hypothetical protein
MTTAHPPNTHSRQDHYLDVEGAMLVPTTASRTTLAHLRTVIKARGIMCVHGRVGLGKTVAVDATLRDLASGHTVKTTSPKLARIRETLYRQMRLPGDVPRRVAQCEDALLHALSERPWVVVCDEAQKLNTTGFEFFRELWDEPATQLTLVFVGSDNCHAKILARPALASRVTTWQPFSPLTPTEVAAIIPQYHSLWADVSAEDIQWLNDFACHGNFRQWAKVTYLRQEAEREHPDLGFSRDAMRWILRGMINGPDIG